MATSCGSGWDAAGATAVSDEQLFSFCTTGRAGSSH